MENPVYVLTDDEELGWAIEDQLLELKYHPCISNTIIQFKNNIKSNHPYWLIVDYLLKEGDCRFFLWELIKTQNIPSGLIVMSGLPGFEDFLDEVAELYTNQEIPFLFLQKPFRSGELSEYLFYLSRGFRSLYSDGSKVVKLAHKRRYQQILRDIAKRKNGFKS
jgi:DNA-binding NtrC family response regulator